MKSKGLIGMDLVEQFEYPLPVLECDISKLVVETTVSGTMGSFKIVNRGGGELIGAIMSNSPSITFETDKFKGNHVDIRYTVDVKLYCIGDMIQSSLALSTNGGEKTIPVVIKIIPPAVLTEEGEQISTLKDFLVYAKKNEYTGKGTALFVSEPFEKWLLSYGFEHIEIYRELKLDHNKERAMENFFVFCKLKNKVALQTDYQKFHYDIMPNVAEMIHGQVRLKKSGWGYFSAEIVLEKNEKWIEVIPKVINNESFIRKDYAIVLFKINTSLIKGRAVSEKIIVNGKVCAEISVNKKSLVEISVSKHNFLFNETGYINIVNNSGKDIDVGLDASDSFIKLSGKRFVIRDSADISFHLRNSPFLTAQAAIKKQPAFSGEITVAANLSRTKIRKSFTITVGEKFLY